MGVLVELVAIKCDTDAAWRCWVLRQLSRQTFINKPFELWQFVMAKPGEELARVELQFLECLSCFSR